MTITNLHSASDARRSNDLRDLASQLYGLIASGQRGLAYNVDSPIAALTILDKGGHRRSVERVGGVGADAPPWQRARELVAGVERDRRFNSWVLESHLRGKYSVAPAAPGWVGWVALDIDAHVMPGSPELEGRRLAKARADRVLAGVWRALGCSAERHPMILRSPGGGYHVWLPLTRGPTSANPEHTWPAAVARAWVERHLVAAGLELAPGVLEVYPSGRCLRAPCGPGMTLLRASRPSDPDALGLEAWPGTMGDRIDWKGTGAELSKPMRRVVPMVSCFLEQWEAQRRTLADWLGRPEASWDPTWGFLGWRVDAEEISPEKNPGRASGGETSASQESDDVSGCRGAACKTAGVGQGVARSVGRRRSEVRILDEHVTPPAEDVDVPPDPAGDRLVRGQPYFRKVRRLLWKGVTEAATRHDAVLTLVFFWGATCGLSDEQVLSRLEAWCRAHPHAGSRLAGRPKVLLVTCLREARSYLKSHGPGWRFRGGGSVSMAALAPADQTIVSAADPRVASEVATILAWLASRADEDGRIVESVQMSARLLGRLCGDRRIVGESGKRHRATTLALEELERLGVVTIASEYRVGTRGRMWSCWYQFGSGALARPFVLRKTEWDEITPFAAKVVAPTLALVERAPVASDSAPMVEVRVLGERVVHEGLVRVLSDGTRGVARTLITTAPEVQRPTAAPALHAPWFVRAWLAMPFTPARLWAADPVMRVAFPDIEQRRRMTRSQRIAWGGGGSSGPSGGSAPMAPVIALTARGQEASSSRSVGAPETGGSIAPLHAAPRADADADRPAAPVRTEQELRAELAMEAGAELAAAVPLELLEVILSAYGGLRGKSRGS